QADVLRFAHAELFDPLGMTDVAMEFDATGTATGAAGMLATPRDWARFGQLYLQDGVVGGKRILPPGWAEYSATPAPDAWVGYGAGFWTNRGDSKGATYRTSWGMPKDSYYASGWLGQIILVVPSERLVIARFGWAHGPYGGMKEMSEWMGAVVAAAHDMK
ncbi:MAG TPA: serine hydrolase, partial [bacterium]